MIKRFAILGLMLAAAFLAFALSAIKWAHDVQNVCNLALDLGSIPEWILAVSALAALWVARGQLKAMLSTDQRAAKALEQQANVARAQLMLEIDKNFEGPDVSKSRWAIRTLRNQCEAIAKKQMPGRDQEAILIRSSDIFSSQLTNLFLAYKKADHEPDVNEKDLTLTEFDSAGPRYATYMALPYWLETVGLLTKNGLLQKNDVLGSTTGCFAKHSYVSSNMSAIGRTTGLLASAAFWKMLSGFSMKPRRGVPGRIPPGRNIRRLPCYASNSPSASYPTWIPGGS